MSHLENQVVLITGCSSGIGRSLAREFARRGHRTFATARRPETLDGLGGERLEALRLDVTDAASMDDAVGLVLERAGRIDVLVNNAGFNLYGPLAEVPVDDVRRLFETNVVGPLALVQRVFPSMAGRRAGRIINVGSVVGVLPTPFDGAYCATKAALHMLSEVLRMELAPFGIDVIVVQPAAVRSSIAASGAAGIERYGAASSRFRAVHREIAERASLSQVHPMDTDEFAARVVDAVTRRRAPRVVRLGRGATALVAAGRLPGSVRDRLLARRFRLDKLRG
jgi:NAD(P)-dependent dehydrogenase (short-subunit alcohol dehydrogenase family)